MTPFENENMAILRNANRYRYLRRHVYIMQNNGYPEFGIVGIRPYMGGPHVQHELDLVIDVAMQEESHDTP